MTLAHRQAVEAEAAAERPLVTVLIPVRNEEHNIGRCLDSVLSNDYPSDRVEILVIDGMSTDASVEVVGRYADRGQSIRLLTNPKHFQAAALNLGIEEAKGDLILRLDAHTFYATDYISRCVDLLQTRDATNVGGVQRAVGSTYFAKAVALAINSPLGIGDAKFRYADKEMLVDTVYLGAWRKQTLESVRGFDEEWVVNEDYELNYRLRRSGGKILLSPAVRSWYAVRSSLTGLARQYFRYGYWRVRTLLHHPDSLRWRQLAPAALTLGLTASPAAALLRWPLGVMVPAVYSVFVVLASVRIGWSGGLRYIPMLPFVLTTIHLSMGLGFVLGLFRWGVPRLGPRTIFRSLTRQDDDLTPEHRSG